MSDLLDKKIAEAGRILALLAADVELAQGNLAQDIQSQFWRRTFIRSIAAMIEGQMFSMKQMLLALSTHMPGSFSGPELALLAEETYDLEESGAIRTQSKFLQVSRNVRFVFGIYTRVLGVTHQVNFRGDGWPAFRNFITIRNRITHPKSTAEWDVSDNEVHQVQIALRWYMEEVWRLLSSHQFAAANIVEDAKAHWSPPTETRVGKRNSKR